MAVFTPSIVPRDLAYAAPAKARPGLLSRILAAMHAARMRQAEREIAHYLASTGDKFTDEAEREIERRFLSGPR